MSGAGIDNTKGTEEGLEFFKKNSEAFAQSISHKAGEDLNVLVDHLPASGRFRALDVATGTGFTAMKLAELYDVVIGLDTTREMLNHAVTFSDEKSVNNLIFIIGRSEKMPFMDRTFDVVTCRRAAHHFIDHEGFVRESKRVLRNGGTFGFVDMLSPDEDNKGLFNQFERTRDETHISAGTKKHWEDILVNEGFKIEFSQVTKEKMTFERWLSPVKADSLQGKKCREYLETNEELKSLLSYNYKDDSLIKQRLVLVAKAPEA